MSLLHENMGLFFTASRSLKELGAVAHCQWEGMVSSATKKSLIKLKAIYRREKSQSLEDWGQGPI